MMNSMRSRLLGVLACGLTLLVGASVYAQSLQEVMQQRGLTENNLLAAAKTYHPSGLKDENVVFSSGGQSGQVIVYGVPSRALPWTLPDPLGSRRPDSGCQAFARFGRMIWSSAEFAGSTSVFEV